MKSTRFLQDEEGATDLVFKLVLAVTISAAVLVIILQILHQIQDTGVSAAETIGAGLVQFAENVSKEIST